MEEIGRLSDRVAVLDAGRVVAIDTPSASPPGWPPSSAPTRSPSTTPSSP
jgi:hypothetical protein